MPTITIKRGDTFRKPGSVLTDAGAAVPTTGWQIAAQVRTPAGALKPSAPFAASV